MTKTTNERFEERFPEEFFMHDNCECWNETGEPACYQIERLKISAFIQQEIDLAKEEGKKEGREEERKRIVEMIEEELELSCVDDRLLGKTDEYLSGYYKSTERWREKRDDLVTLITNNK